MMSMITSDVLTSPAVVGDEVLQPALSIGWGLHRWERGGLRRVVWVSLLLACLGVSWFTYQFFLVSQPKSFVPDWQRATWVQAANSNAPVAYFRFGVNLNVLPDAAFVTVQASQGFYLFLNGSFVGSNTLALRNGDYSRAYMYGVTSLLQASTNIIAVRVTNDDEHTPVLRLSLGIVNGKSTSYYGTGNGWRATGDSSQVYLHYTTQLNDSTSWTKTAFNSKSWLPVRSAMYIPTSATVDVDPQTYEQPTPSRWLSVGLGHDAYFVRPVSLSSSVVSAWLRIVANGTASIFINNQLLMVWNGQPPAPTTDLAYYLSTGKTSLHRPGFASGVYDISPYLHAGENVVAVHVSASGNNTALNGFGDLNASMSLDMLINDTQNHSIWVTPGGEWYASHQPVGGWQQGGTAIAGWSAPIFVNRPGLSRLFYLPDSTTTRNVQIIPPSLLFMALLCSMMGVLGLWFFISLLFHVHYHISYRNTLEITSLAYVPALACEALLVALSREPQMPQPFPYTAGWGGALVLMLGAGYLLLWCYVRTLSRQSAGGVRRNPLARRFLEKAGAELALIGVHFTHHSQGDREGRPYHTRLHQPLRNRVGATLAVALEHWLLILIVLVAIPLVTYNLAYDPYWQDELTSYYAARGILAHGLPVLPSGFLYMKGELYSYVLALNLLIFGDQAGIPRIFSTVEYLASIPVLYGVGCYFFNRRVALLAAAMFAFSPFALGWGREMRMYQQAQLLTMLTVYLLYKALQERQRARSIYFAIACLVATYLSHEESFIIFPALVLWVVVASRDTKHRNFAAFFNKHWWFAGVIGAGIVAVQLIIVHVTHPAVLGTDSSQRPFLQLNADGIPYYTNLLFFPWALYHGTLTTQVPLTTVNSLLAVIGCFWAMRLPDRRAKYCAWFLIASLLTLVLVFTMQSDRYFYLLLPFYYLLGAYALYRILHALWMFHRSCTLPERVRQNAVPAGSSHSPLVVGMMACTASLVCACVLLLPMLPLANYNLFVSRVAGFSYYRHHPDYDNAGQYIHQHWRNGDVVIALGPSLSILYYVGRVDYFFSPDHALYLFERGSEITDTPVGAVPLLNQDDFQAVLASHDRIWIVADGTYQNQTRVKFNGRFVFPPDFHLVYEGYSSAVYLRGG
jgi:Dolichyl-phosphate-mannose-protein mannosyltransferase